MICSGHLSTAPDGHPGLGLGLMLAVGLYGWWILVGKNRLRKSERVILPVTLLGLIAAGCDHSMVYGPLLAMSVGSSGLILLVTGRDYAAADDMECEKYLYVQYDDVLQSAVELTKAIRIYSRQ